MDEKTTEALREVFEQWRQECGYNTESFSSVLWQAWLACYQHLEPQLKDGERYRFLRDEGHDDCGDGPWSDGYRAIASTWLSAAEIDAEVDAALDQQKEKQQC